MSKNGDNQVCNKYAGDGRVTRQFLHQDTEHVILYDDNNRVNTFLNLSNDDRLEYHYNKDKLIIKIPASSMNMTLLAILPV